MDLAHGLERWGAVSVQTLPELELHAPPSLGILSWGTVSVKSLWTSTRPRSLLSLGSPHKADPETRTWVQGVY